MQSAHRNTQQDTCLLANQECAPAQEPAIKPLPAGLTCYVTLLLRPFLQACDVILLLPGATLTLPNANAAEAAAYGSSQQLFALLAGLLEAAEAGRLPGLQGLPEGARALWRLLPRPAVPPKAGVSWRL